MILTFLKGIIIGIVVSAPMGPVGLLCLRETMHHGRKSGLLTGLGATLSDLVYGFIAYWGVSLIVDLLNEYDALLRILGGVVIMLFAYFVYRQSATEIKPYPSKLFGALHGVRKVSTAFVVTLSNPFILFLFIPLYARFGFVQEAERDGLGVSLAMLGLAMGCLMWWLGLTYLVSHATRRLGKHWLSRISHMVAAVLFAIGILGFYTGLAYYFPWLVLIPKTQ